MTDSIQRDAVAEQLGLDEAPLPDLFSRLVNNAKEVARAEIDCFRAKAFRRLVKARGAIFLGVASMLLTQAAVITALVALVAILTFPLGLIWAAVIVVFGTLIIAGILGRLALNRIQKIVNPEEGLP
ncbi:MAG: phage holin family protein [Sphingomonas sp.]